MSIRIVKTGLLSCIQDAGRHGYQSIGVGRGGYADENSACLAHLLTGKELTDPLFELGTGQTLIEVRTPVSIAVTGPGLRLWINETEVPAARLIHLYQATQIRIEVRRRYAYLAFSRSCKLPQVLGSYSTHSVAPLGLSPLRAGQVIEFEEPEGIHLQGKTGFAVEKWYAAVPDFRLPGRIRVVRGPEYELFSDEARACFWSQPFTLSVHSSRMGYQLNEKLPGVSNLPGIASTAVCKGIIQVTPDGSPIILQPDAQTTGGYPRLGWVVQEDLSTLTQMLPGEMFMFQEIGEEEAERLFLARQESIQQLKSAIRERYRGY